MADRSEGRDPAVGRFALISCGVLAYVFLAALIFYRPEPEPRLTAAGPSTTSDWSSDPSTPWYASSTATTVAPYPTVASRGCTPNESWTTEQANEWLRAAALHLPEASDSTLQIDFDFRLATVGSTGPLCQPVAVRVDYWEVQITETFFSYTDTRRQEYSVDGRTAQEVTAPFRAGGCTGVLVAVYTGSPMGADELPESINTESRQLSIGGVRYDVRHELNFGRTDLVHKAFSGPIRGSSYLTPTC